MRAFTALYERLDATTSTNAKIAAMADYFAAAGPADAGWAVFFLSGRRLKRLIGAAELRGWIREQVGMAEWLFEESYAHVGDLAETAALLLRADDAAPRTLELSLSELVEQRLLPLRGADESVRRATLAELWAQVPAGQLFVLNKIVTGALRVGVSQRLLVRALEQATGIEDKVLAHRLMGQWEPGAEFYDRLVSEDDGAADLSRPYPFFLASPLEDGPSSLGPIADWHAEWKWDGIRAQIVRRGGRCFVWSRGEELMEGRFPEIEAAAMTLPDGVVVDGELLAWADGAPLDFSVMQKRIGRRQPGAGILKSAPVWLMAYDLLEHEGRDLRDAPLTTRRTRLAELVRGRDRMLLSPTVEAEDWDALAALREESRARRTEGLMLKRADAPYGVGRRRGAWWKWKVDPHTIDAVLIYAQAGHGRRSNLFTDYTFALWRGEELVPVAKAYSGLDQEEIDELDRWIRRHTRERFGPVRSVEPAHVFELAFEGIHASTRHKSGVAVRFPRIARWRRDLSVADADRLEDLERLAHG
ncbi:MAG: ATP-dependent DNA ligase [Pseudomonadales bacterium]|jgi:DNA ligase-1|nr:ATP-dependent DNA ligase [Pseudomonadales bacterium]